MSESGAPNSKGLVTVAGRVIPGVRNVIKLSAERIEQLEVVPAFGRKQTERGNETRFAGS